MINQDGEFILKIPAMKKKCYYYFGFYRDYIHKSRPIVLQVTTNIDCLSCEILGGEYPLIRRQLTPEERNHLANELALQHHASYIEIGDGARKRVTQVNDVPDTKINFKA